MAVIKVSKILEETIEECRAVIGETVMVYPTEAIRIYEVTTAMSDGAETAISATDGVTTIPTPGTQWSGTYTTLIAQTPRVAGAAPLWRVTIPYTTNDVLTKGRKAKKPTDRDPLVTETPMPFTAEVDRDYAGNLIRNSAKELLSAPVQLCDKQITLTWNATTHVNLDDKFAKTNSDKVTINGVEYAAHALLCLGVSSQQIEEEYEGSLYQYYTRVATFGVRLARSTDDPADWKEKILNQGTKHLDGGVQVANTDKEGNILGERMKLDENGYLTDTPYWLSAYNAYSTNGATSRVQMYATASFASFPFP